MLWVNVDRGETHEGVIKARYGDQVPPGVEPVSASYPRVCRATIGPIRGIIREMSDEDHSESKT